MTQELRDLAQCLGIPIKAMTLQIELAKEAGWDTTDWTDDDLHNAVGMLCQDDIDNMILAGRGDPAAIAAERKQWQLPKQPKQ